MKTKTCFCLELVLILMIVGTCQLPEIIRAATPAPEIKIDCGEINKVLLGTLEESSRLLRELKELK